MRVNAGKIFTKPEYTLEPLNDSVRTFFLFFAFRNQKKKKKKKKKKAKQNN